MKKLYGVTVAMVTPLKEDGSVFEESIRKHVEFLIDKGVHCLYPLGTTGEMYLLTLEERKKVAETVISQVNGRVPVYIHVGAMNEHDTIELAKHACNKGADGIGVITPTFFMVNDKEMEEYYVTIANSVPDDFPVYLYNIPQRSGNDLKPETIECILKRTANVVGIKYSFPDLGRTREYLEINNGNFSVLQGADSHINTFLCMGCDGVVSGISSVCPEPFVSAYNEFISGNMEKARIMQNTAAKVTRILKSGTNMAYFKAGLKLRGIDAGHMRRPLLDLTEVQMVELHEKLKMYI